MHCGQLARHSSDSGSAVTGFAIVAPLISLVFVAIIAIAGVLGQRVVLGAAASSGARMAATLGATRSQAQREIDQVLSSFTLDPADVSSSMWRGSAGGIPTVYVKLTKSISIPWIHEQITIVAISHRIDENS